MTPKGFNFVFTDSFFVLDEVDEDDQSVCSASDGEEQRPQHVSREQIRKWSLEHNIAITALSDLLKILHLHFPHLPLDGRTLLETGKHKHQIQEFSNGKFVYFGLTKFLDHFPSDAQIDINIDGLQLYKNSDLQCWPILASVNSCTPLVIAIFCGPSKPDLNSFLCDFVQECSLHDIRIRAFICDSPARAFIKNIKSHSGYSSCDKCTTVGKYCGRVVFDEIDATLRCDNSFRQQLDKNHHTGTTPLVNLPVDMVKGFPLDYMHLVCLGVMRRLMMVWLAGPLKYRLSAHMSRQISERLLNLSLFIPSDFNRRPRSLNLIKYWKATEFRTFLLYAGAVVLKNVLPRQMYRNFLQLHAAIFMLCDQHHVSSHLQRSKEILMSFVDSCKTCYGLEFLSFNVHSLIHLPNDCERFGSLDSFSAFKFENRLRLLRRKLRSSNRPLEQLVNRMEEEDLIPTEEQKRETFTLQEHCDGPLTHTQFGQTQYKTLVLKGVRFSVSGRDSCFIKNRRVYKVVNIVRNANDISFVCKTYKNEPFYNFPVCSSVLDIYKVKNLSTDLCLVRADTFCRKCVSFPYKEQSCVVFPMSK